MTVIRAKPVEDLQAVASEVEGEIREFVRRDVAALRKPQAEPANDFSVNSMSSLIQRVAGTSLREIDVLITELQTVREFLTTEGERVQREIAGYAHLSQAAMKSMKMITDGMSDWKNALGNVRGARN